VLRLFRFNYSKSQTEEEGIRIGIKIKLDRKNKIAYTDEMEHITALNRTSYGHMDKGRLILTPEETLYLMDIRNARCIDDKEGTEYSFDEVAKIFYAKKLMARFFTLKDWRDRGLIIRPYSEAKRYKKWSEKKYPSEEFQLDKYKFEGLFFPEDLMTISDNMEIGKLLYDTYWFGQFGTYKAEHRGKTYKLDIYETIFLMKHSGLKTNYSKTKIMKFGKEKHKNFKSMYDVYEDWRLRGYVLKTGFKFGTHFRVYFPGARPGRKGSEWIHSKHVLHIFPKKEKMLISEWARVVRVAHSVRKTFIMAIPSARPRKMNVESDTRANKSKRKPKHIDLDFLLYHRIKGGIAMPKENNPKFLLLSLSEEEYIGGYELSNALDECKQHGLKLLLGIADRESGVTYYLVYKINLPGSRYEYYEVEWIQP